MNRKPLTQGETDEFHGVLRRAAERMERRKRRGTATDAEVEQLAHAIADCEQAAQENETETLAGVLAALRDEPREA